MERSLAELEAIVREKVCGVCSDRSVDGGCGLEEPAGCALFRMFPQVAKAIQSVRSNDIGEYVEALRSQVCTICVEQAADGTCDQRRQVTCALDAYLLLIVEAIEEAKGIKIDRSALGALKRPTLRRGAEVVL